MPPLAVVGGVVVVLSLVALAQLARQRDPGWDAVPLRGSHDAGAEAADAGPLDLATAGTAELVALPRIGPALAQRIVASREGGRLQSVDDLVHVSGIGPRTVEALRPLVIFSSLLQRQKSAVQSASSEARR